MAATLGFFTQNELDQVVGYSRRRQRLVQSKVLPQGERVKTFGQELIIFPEFAAAGLLAERPSPQDEPLLAHLASASQRLYKTPSFREMAGVLRSALRGTKGWRLEDLVEVLLERASDGLAAWRMEVAAAERDLAGMGIRLSIELGQIREATDTGYRIALAEGNAVITVAINAARAPLPVGTWVTRDIVELGARRGELLVPTVAPALIAPISEKTTADVPDGAEFEEMFGEVDFRPVAVPLLRDTVNEPSDVRGDLVRPKRRLQVRANRALYANANTMVRSSATHPTPR